MPKIPWGNASRKITVKLGESFLGFLVLLVVVLSLFGPLTLYHVGRVIWAGGTVSLR